jgi:three-Cys-motif partner protein
MSDNINVTWQIEPHTEAKHDILRYYLGAWFPILATAQRRLIYIDGFAGPGEYDGGEDGSPIIALKAASDHVLKDKLQRVGMQLVFFFIEKDEARFQNLQRRLAGLKLPNNFRIIAECDSFESAFGSVLTEIEQQSKQLAPSFVFIDPFGPTGFPMSLVERLAKQERSEVLITFNYQSLNQWFLQDESKHQSLDQLYGSDIWRPALNISDSSQKEAYLRQAYQNTLEKLGWKVRPFQMINKRNQTQYYLFFATTHWLGMLVMKRAMWGAAPTGDFKYSDLTSPLQGRLFEKVYDEEYSQQLANQLCQYHRGQTVSKRTLIQNQVAWHPVCIDRHLTRALSILEYESTPPKVAKVELPGGKKRRERSYPDGCTITFTS